MTVAGVQPMATAKKKPQGLYANIHAKRERIAHGSGEHMRKKGEDGAPTAGQFKKSEKTSEAELKRKRSAAAKKAAKTRAANQNKG